ncbi:MAG TPA: TauD/TfdA family dioxygenase [Acidimicrobiales bacterium]
MGDFWRIDVRPLNNVIGAEVGGVDLREPIDDEVRDEIREALGRHLVLFFRDQDIGDAEQLAFARRFGEPYDPYVDSRELPGNERFFVSIEDTPESPPKADHWHTDVPFRLEPPDISVLHMRVAPPAGGDTLWVNTRALYERLSPTMRRLLDQLDVIAGIGTPVKAAYEHDPDGAERFRQLQREVPPSRHPLVRVHPDTGAPAVFFPGDEFVRGIAGMTADESDAVLGVIRARLDDPNLQVRWRWRLHDVAMWDERCTNHRAMSDHYPSHRLVRRCLTGCGVPVGVDGRESSTVVEER